MERWEAALQVFLQDWQGRDDVVGGLVCGSFVTGDPSPHSDIDAHIILREGVDWRERGNRVIDGFLVEYFANPPRRIRRYFTDDHSDSTRDTATQFATGRVLFDKDGTVGQLKVEALEWLGKPFEPMSEAAVEAAKYNLWDSLDNLLDACKQNSRDSAYVYHHVLRRIYDAYARCLGEPAVHYSKQIMCLSCPQTARRKYLMEPFPDQRFVEMFVESLAETTHAGMSRRATDLTWHVLNALGGFEIDGWRLRSSATE